LVIMPVAVVIAVGVKVQTGEREVLGFDVGPSEDGAFLTSFLRSLWSPEGSAELGL
jgi:putative transposase